MADVPAARNSADAALGRIMRAFLAERGNYVYASSDGEGTYRVCLDGIVYGITAEDVAAIDQAVAEADS